MRHDVTIQYIVRASNLVTTPACWVSKLTVLLHALQKLHNNLTGRSDQDLALAALFSISDCVVTEMVQLCLLEDSVQKLAIEVTKLLINIILVRAKLKYAEYFSHYSTS